MEQNLLGTGELGKSEFRRTGSLIFEQQGNNCQFLLGTREHAPTPPPPPNLEALSIGGRKYSLSCFTLY